MTTATVPDRRPAAPGSASSQWTIAATIWARAVADLTAIVGALSFYGLALGVAVGALWPPLKKTFASLSAAMPAAIDRMLGNVSMASPAGWMNAEMISIMAPAFLIAIAVISAGRAIAAEEDGQTMALVLSTPASRTTFLAAKTAAMATHVRSEERRVGKECRSRWLPY